MQGIKKHTHQDRAEVIKQLIPIIKDKYGENLVALAVEGSYVRDEDTDYSDLEMIVFLKENPKSKNWEMRRIVDGLYIVVVSETRQSYFTPRIEEN